MLIKHESKRHRLTRAQFTATLNIKRLSLGPLSQHHQISKFLLEQNLHSFPTCFSCAVSQGAPRIGTRTTGRPCSVPRLARLHASPPEFHGSNLPARQLPLRLPANPTDDFDCLHVVQLLLLLLVAFAQANGRHRRDEQTVLVHFPALLEHHLLLLRPQALPVSKARSILSWRKKSSARIRSDADANSALFCIAFTAPLFRRSHVLSRGALAERRFRLRVPAAVRRSRALLRRLFFRFRVLRSMVLQVFR